MPYLRRLLAVLTSAVSSHGEMSSPQFDLVLGSMLGPSLISELIHLGFY
jgi:hypothetical protein